MYGVAAALPIMLKQKQGHIINIASVYGIKVYAPGGTVYCATKAVVRTLTEGLRMERTASSTAFLVSRANELVFFGEETGLCMPFFNRGQSVFLLWVEEDEEAEESEPETEEVWRSPVIHGFVLS